MALLYPAIFNRVEHDILDQSVGDRVGDWIVNNPIENIIIFVDEGGFDDPFYTFYDDSGDIINELKIDLSKNYTFKRLNNANSHPFFISDVGYKEKSTSNIIIDGDGAFDEGIKGDQTFTIHFKDSNSLPENFKLYFYCTSHSSMNAEFDINQNLQTSAEVTYLNTANQETRTLEQMIADGWTDLSKKSEVEDVFIYNMVTKEKIRLEDMVASTTEGGKGWTYLLEKNYPGKYKFPAIYSSGEQISENSSARGVLDMSLGGQHGDWVVWREIYTESEDNIFFPGSEVSFDLLYETYDDEDELSGIPLQVHYDSSILTPSAENNGVSALVDTFGDSIIQNDIANLDNDPATDKFIKVTWLNSTSNSQVEQLPGSIANLNFSSQGIDYLTGESWENYPWQEESKINITSSDPLTGYNFLSQKVVIKPQFNLDADGDGKVTALGDGLMFIRKLFGRSFDGDKLTNRAMSNNATRTTDQIHDYIQSAVDTKVLDLDGDGRVTALGDGLMVIRKLFGRSFNGDKLTNRAMSNDAIRTTDEIHEYMEAMTTLDPVG